MVILINILWLLTSLFLIVVVLIQRGKGGGLAGAFGGVGGSSAFGTRAGDLFTKITVGVFIVWLLLAISLVPLMKRAEVYTGGAEASTTPDVGAAAEPSPATTMPASGTPESQSPPSETPATSTEVPPGTSETKPAEAEESKAGEPKTETPEGEESSARKEANPQ